MHTFPMWGVSIIFLSVALASPQPCHMSSMYLSDPLPLSTSSPAHSLLPISKLAPLLLLSAQLLPRTVTRCRFLFLILLSC